MTVLDADAGFRAGAAAPRGPRDDLLRHLPLLAALVDVLVVNATVSLAILGRRSLPVLPEAPGIAETVGPVAPALVVGWVAVLALSGAHARDLFAGGTEEYRRVVHGSLLTAGAVGVLSYLAKHDLSRGFFVIAFTLGVPALLLGRRALRGALRAARRRGALVERVLVAGTAEQVDELDAVFAREPWLGYRTVGALTTEATTEPTEPTTGPATGPATGPTTAGAAGPRTPGGTPVVGCVEDARRVAADLGVDALVLASGAVRSAAQMRHLLWELERDEVRVIVTPSVHDVAGERLSVRPVAGLPMIHLGLPRSLDASRWGKRAFDVVGAAALLVLATPLLLVAALRVRLHDGGPVLFRQTRVGRDGRAFACLKLRTMVVDAERRVTGLQAERGASPLLFKVADDPRVTAPGRWLRRFSLDELPQLVNVLRGDMSLVGPRPQVPAEVALYDDVLSRRLRVRPGLTGLWQVSGRSDLAAADAARLDLYYVDNWSMVQDLAILARTVRAVLGARGAY